MNVPWFLFGWAWGGACMWMYFSVSGLLRSRAEWYPARTPSPVPDVAPLPWDNDQDPTADQLIDAMGTAICEMGESTYVPLQFKQHRLLLEGRQFLNRSRARSGVPPDADPPA
jgi:hypothetical protein